MPFVLDVTIERSATIPHIEIPDPSDDHVVLSIGDARAEIRLHGTHADLTRLVDNLAAALEAIRPASHQAHQTHPRPRLSAIS